MEQMNINDAVKEYEEVKMKKWINNIILDYETYLTIDNKNKSDKE